MISPILELSDDKKTDVKPPVMPTEHSFTVNDGGSYISKVISTNIFKPENPSNTTKISIEPLILFGKNMDSSNANIVFPDNADIHFTPNTQNLRNQGIMLANIKLTDTTSVVNDTVTSTVFYTVSKKCWYQCSFYGKLCW